MKDILNYFIKSLASSTITLKKKNILIDKPWTLIDTDGEILKFIFKKDQRLVISKNGKVQEGKWEYFPEAKSLLIDRVSDKLLLKEQFFDEKLLILKKDGTENDFLSLANENKLSSNNIPKYLNHLKCLHLKILEIHLISGNKIQVHGGANLYYKNLKNLSVEQIDPHYKPIGLSDGIYLSRNRCYNIHIANKQLIKITPNILKKLRDNKVAEIEEGNKENPFKDINKRITINGNPIPDKRVVDINNFIYELNESIICQIYVIKNYQIKDGPIIKIEQQVFDKITKGDKIISIEFGHKLSDGSYKLRGNFSKIKIRNHVVV